MNQVTNKEEILSRVIKVVSEVLKVEPSKISIESKYKEDLGADSLDIVSLLMAFEDEFKAAIPDSDAMQLLSISATVDYITDKIQTQVA